MRRAWQAAIILAAAAGCQSPGLPPPAELAERSAAIDAQVRASEPLLAGEGQDDQLRRLDAVLQAIASRYGEVSVESVQAATETGLLLIRHDRYDLAEPYMELALRLSREVFGTDHRETGYALHDLAIVRDRNRREPFDQAIRPLMEEAIAVRSRTLGRDHQETAASERTFARMLLQAWRRSGDGDVRSALLVESRSRTSRALPALERALGREHAEVADLHYLRAEIALERGDFRLAQALARALVDVHRRPCSPFDANSAARRIEADALRGLGQDAEADALLAAAPADECGDDPREAPDGLIDGQAVSCGSNAEGVADQPTVELACGTGDLDDVETGGATG